MSSKDPSIEGASDPSPDHDGFAPLPGEPGIPDVAQARRTALSIKGLLAVVLLVGSVVAVSVVTLHRLVASRPVSADTTTMRDRPAAAGTEPRRLDMTAPSSRASAPAAVAPRIPALVPTPEEAADPIGVRRSTAGASPAGPKPTLPEDAPVLLVTSRPGASGAAAARPPAPADNPSDPDDPLASTTRNLQGYQRQLQGLLDQLTQSTAVATGQAPVPTPGAMPYGASPAGAPPSPGLFGGQLQGSATPRVAAGQLGDRSLTLPKGTAFTCALKTRVVSATSGLVGCQVQRNVYGGDGRVLLIERGSHLDGEYRITSVRPGTVRIPVLWTRLRTPLGVTVDIESPGTGSLGESGIDGHVDNRWRERIGAAMLLSLIDDSVKLVIQNQSHERSGDTIVLPSSTANTSKLAEKVLDSTIQIPPLIYQHQGGLVGIYVARDVDFLSVYALQPSDRSGER